MQVGDDIFVIGAPYGMGHSLSAGHVRARRLPKNARALALEMLQTDAAINKGSFGGPMFNLPGEVVGIVSLILSQSGGSEGLGSPLPRTYRHAEASATGGDSIDNVFASNPRFTHSLTGRYH